MELTRELPGTRSSCCDADVANLVSILADSYNIVLFVYMHRIQASFVSSCKRFRYCIRST